jgi:hypothetical protein
MPLYTIVGTMKSTGEDYTMTSEFTSEAKARNWASGAGVDVFGIQLAAAGTKNITKVVPEASAVHPTPENELLRTQQAILQQTTQICFWVRVWSILVAILIVLWIVEAIVHAISGGTSAYRGGN